MDSAKLSILLPTVLGRENLFSNLLKEILRQKNELPNPDLVEVLIDKDNKEVSIGAKRQRMLEKSTGEYIVFIDDDDLVSDKYIFHIISALAHEGVDCVGFLIDCDIEGKRASAISSLKYKQWGENIDGFDYVRSIYHKTPVKRSIAIQVGFPDLRFAEDHPYSMGVTKLCQSEVFISEVLYYYRYKWEDKKTKYGIK